MHLILALLAGLTSVLAFAPFEVFLLAPLSLAALFWLMDGENRTRRVVLTGFCWGLGAFLAGVGWLFVAMHRYGGMAVPLAALALLLFCTYLALYPAFMAWLYARLRRGGFWGDALLLASCWTISELLRGWAFTGFPWLAIGYSQTSPSPLAGWAPILGAYGLSFFVALFAALLAKLLRGNWAWVSLRWQAAMLVLVIVAMGAGLARVRWTHPVGAPISVALLQTNVAQDQKWQPGRLMDWLDLNYALVERQKGARLVVLPETSLPMLTDQLPEGYLDALRQGVSRRKADLIVGVFTREGRSIYNSALSLGTSPAQAYHKHHLVPFGEYSPPLFGWFFELAHIPMADQTRGAARQAPLAIAGQKIAINICYEDVFGEELLSALPEASLMLNISNLAWYGDSHAQPQHLQIARLRALETGRPMLRSTNTGMTALIQPDGRVEAALPAFTAGALRVEVSGFAGQTPYSRWANWPVILLAGGGVLWAALLRRRSQQKPA